MGEGTAMEVPLVEERPVAVERLHGYAMNDGRLDDGLVGGGFTRRGGASRLPILEMYASAGGGASGTPPLVPRRNAAAADVSRLTPVRPTEEEGLLHYYPPGYGAADALRAAGDEQRGELGFMDRLRSLHIGDKRDAAADDAPEDSNPVDLYGIWRHRGTASPESGLLNSPPLFLRNPVGLSDQEKPVLSPPPQHWLRPCFLSHRMNVASSHPDGLCSESINLLTNDGTWRDVQLYQDLGFGGHGCQTAKQVVDPLFYEGIEEFLAFQKKRIGCDDHVDVSTPPILPQTLLPNSHSGFSILSQRRGLSSSGNGPQSVSPFRNTQVIKAFTCEDSFIIQGNELRCLSNSNCCGLQRERKSAHMDSRLNSAGAPLMNTDNLQSRGHRVLPFVVPKYQSLMDIRGFMFLAAKDQHGCRFLQRKFDEGTCQEREMIFNEIIGHVPELMVNPFGNYLMQKVLDVCTEDQRREIIHVLTKDPIELERISLNMHGTRAVQRLIETLKNKKQIEMIISALQPGFLSLIKDPNGNHVIQRCLQYFSYDDSKFIFDAAARHCVDIARHRHGCCVLQRCIAHSTGKHQVKLLAEVSRNGLVLAQDAYGNYAVQYILDMKNPLVIENVKSKFKGNYVQLSMQKFSSNVVEKCLSVFDEIGRRRIIFELLSVACFEQFMQDPYANYVIQSALLICKGHARSLLVDAIRSHDAVLRTSPYCKRIFNILKK